MSQKSLIVLSLCVGFCVLAGTAYAEVTPSRDAVESTARGGLPNVLAKLQSGQDVRIAYLGGSITAQPGWRVLTRVWFAAQYPNANVSEINAAIGGTGSDLGVFRLEQDVLRHAPDLLFVEFAVNDHGAPLDRIEKAMEGLVRQTWAADPTTDICFVYTIDKAMLADLQAGRLPPPIQAMESVAEQYAIPSINMGLEAARLEKAGKLVFTAPGGEKQKALDEGKIPFAPDNCHPYVDTGHPLYLDAVVRAVSQMKGAGRAGAHEVPSPLVADHWERARLVPVDRARLSEGWTKLDRMCGRPTEPARRSRFASRARTRDSTTSWARMSGNSLSRSMAARPRSAAGSTDTARITAAA